ncbi:hypothetical protein GCM10010329_67740 [Streptomyces spiroverticillatus]|uniref:Uncharacterized protein n=1 Tax=Streptomyces finlayi TaxID=67296 RepID=A0A918X572_9ACTN|nr:hypothetical protein [Streptomyces finlayi]GHA35049.1 hypothetical protein GCM10010329_67740 [Streptomyces spiroverticillatus]GHD13108.1 hypothetical protein GCM10010334_70930 [Streptomyces finlayi]
MRTRRATLPARLRLLRTAVLALAGALLILLATGGLALSSSLEAIAERHVPRITSAAGLNLALNDMDAQAANTLLASGDAGAGRLATPYRKALELYGTSRRTISRELRTLAVAADGDPHASRTVEALTENFARYQEFIGRALENDGRPAGKQPARDDYHAATELLRTQLLPESRELTDVNNRTYTAEVTSARDRITVECAVALLLGVTLLALLVGLQLHLARRFQRILNPPLLAATFATLLALTFGGHVLLSSSEQLRIARHDAFDSVVALSRARATAYDLNADESRYLLFADRRDTYECSYFAKSQNLYEIRGATFGTYNNDLSRTWAAYRADRTDLRFGGEFRRELDNITFPGEREAAERTVAAYAVYQRDDRTLRALVAQGKEREAVAFGIGWQEGQSNAHFGAWTTALDRAIAINRTHYEQATAEGRSLLAGPLLLAGGTLVAAAALTVLGLRPRLRGFSNP